jgi:hypothetical protein
MPAGSEDRRAILAGLGRTASDIDDLALRALRSGQVTGTPSVSGYRVAPEGIVVDLTGVSVVLPPSKEVAAAVFSKATPAAVSRLVSMLPALAPFAPFAPASKLPAAQFKSKAKAMVQRGLDVYSKEDLVALVEGQKKEVPKGTPGWRGDPGTIWALLVDITDTLDVTPGYEYPWWHGTVDKIGETILNLHLSVKGGVVTASGEMGFQTKVEPFKATKPMRAYMGGFVGESEAEIRRTYPPSFLRGVKIEDEGGGNVNWYLNNVNWPDVPELDLRGMTFRYLNYNGPYKVNIPLRSLSRKALEDLVQVLAK